MASKRSGAPGGSAASGSNEPPTKKSFLLSEPINIGPVSTEVWLLFTIWATEISVFTVSSK